MTSLSMSDIAAGKIGVIAALKILLSPLRHERRRLVKIGLALTLLALAQGAFLLAIGPLLKSLFATSTELAGLQLRDILPGRLLDIFGVAADAEIGRAQLVLVAPLMLLTAGVAKATASYLYQYNQQALAYIIAAMFRRRIFAAIIRAPLQTFNQRSPGAWMSMIMNDVHFLQTKISDVMTSLLRDGVSIVACLGFLAFLHWQSALLLALLTPLFALVLGRVGGRIAYYAEFWQRALSELAGVVLEMRGRFDFVRAQKAEAYELARFGRRNTAYYKMLRRSLAVRALFAPSIELAGFLLFAGLVVALRHNYLGDINPENLVQIFAAMGLMFRPWRSVGEQYAALQETIGALRSAVSAALVVETESSGRDHHSSHVDLGLARADVMIDACACGFGGQVQFRADSIRLAAGRNIAIIGRSGSGKSTFVKTLAGLYEPISWRAKAAWMDVAEQAAFVSQEPFLFAGTLLDNLLYGLSEAERPQAQADLPMLLALVNLSADIAKLPAGLATDFSPLSGSFSGGQVQRLVIVRMLLRRKSLWLLDEATSAVDAATDGMLVKAIAQLAKERKAAIIWVTHRLQHLDVFDEVWYIDGGRIVSRGAHLDLLTDVNYRAYTMTQDS